MKLFYLFTIGVVLLLCATGTLLHAQENIERPRIDEPNGQQIVPNTDSHPTLDPAPTPESSEELTDENTDHFTNRFRRFFGFEPLPNQPRVETPNAQEQLGPGCSITEDQLKTFLNNMR
jgi:hypothetical protein